MKTIKMGFTLTEYNSAQELPAQYGRLMQKAVEVRKNAYAPYSNFRVGAAVLLESGEVVLGNNQENASYPSGLCAERVAIFHAGANYPNQKIMAVAISAASDDYEVKEPAGPCGNCRQSMAEYEYKQKAPIVLILQGESGPVVTCESIADILPLGFNNSFLSDS
jgi:cytidine deaminase